MVTIVTEVELKQGAEAQWDHIMSDRMAASKAHSGWISGQMLRPDDGPRRRVIVGTGKSREDWKNWHTDPKFRQARRDLDRCVDGRETCSWHDVVLARRCG